MSSYEMKRRERRREEKGRGGMRRKEVPNRQE